MPSLSAAPKSSAASGSVSDGQSPLGSWSTGPPSGTPQRSPAPSAAAAAAAISGARPAPSAPVAPYPTANEIVSYTITQVESLLDKTLAPLAERLKSIEATQRGGGEGGGGPPDPSPPGSDVGDPATNSSSEGSSYGGSVGSRDVPGPEEYVHFTRENRHFVARVLRDEDDQRPRRTDLHSNKTWGLLSDGKRGSGGTLGFSFEYAEPIAAFQCQAHLFLQDVIAGLDAGSYTESDLRYQLTVLGNTMREIYALSNEHRALLELKAKSLSGDDYDKQCMKHVERSFHIRDYASPDLPSDIAELQEEFATDTHREQRRTAAKQAAKGGQPSGGGGSSRSRGEKSRSDRSARDRPKDKPSGRRAASPSTRRDRRGKDESDGEQQRGRDRGGGKERRGSPARDKSPSASRKPKSSEHRSHSGGKSDDRDRRSGGKSGGSSGQRAAGKAAGSKPARRGRDSSRSESGSGSD